MAYKIVSEHFNTIYEFLRISKSRPSNKAMSGEHASTATDDSEWYGTKCYEEAEELFRNGYTDILPEVLKGVNEAERLYTEESPIQKMIPKTQVVGYAPHVPNAIIGIPESMIFTDRIIHKKKTIDITYSCSVNCYIEAEQMKRAGIALLSAIKLIENSGIFINLDLAAFISETSREISHPTINLKRYHERLDIQKLCFPLAHPSMLRRFGFKWMETCPEITDTNFRGGYGHSIEDVADIKRKLKFADNMHVLNANWIIDHKYNVKSIIKYLKDEFK